MNPEHSQSNHPKFHATIGFHARATHPPVDLESFLDLTTRAVVDGRRFDGIDLALHESYLPPGAPDARLKGLAANVRERELVIGSLAAPGSATGGPEQWLADIRATCRIGRRLRSLGVRPYGVIQIGFGYNAAAWTQDPFGAQRKAVEALRAACSVADEFGERLAIRGVNRQGEPQDWRAILDLLLRVNRTGTLGYHVDLAETVQQWQQTASNDPEMKKSDSKEVQLADVATKELAAALRPWMISLNVGQSDGLPPEHHRLLSEPEGQFQIVHHVGAWLHGEDGRLTKGLQHLTWDAGPFPAVILQKQETWDRALEAMLAIRDAHGWKESGQRRHVDPAQIILQARKAARGRQGGAMAFGPVRRRQTTLKVAPKPGASVSPRRQTKASSPAVPKAKPQVRSKSKSAHNGEASQAAARKRAQRQSPSVRSSQVKDRAKRAKQTAPVQAARRRPSKRQR